MEKQITTAQYANIHKRINEIQAEALKEYLNTIDSEYERKVVQNAIDSCLDWVSHYQEMLDDLEERFYLIYFEDAVDDMWGNSQKFTNRIAISSESKSFKDYRKDAVQMHPITKEEYDAWNENN